jgi:hypothetical protein
MSQFAAKLTEMFEAVESEFRAAQVARYRLNAEAAHKAWADRIKGAEPTDEELQSKGLGYFRVSKRELMYSPEYTKRKDGSGVYTSTWSMLREEIVAGEYMIDFKRAEADANRLVSDVKRAFIAKQTAKLTNATQLRKGQATLTGQLNFGTVMITGELVVRYKNGDSFTLAMSITYNRSSQGKDFCQYPARFTNVRLNGKCPKTGVISEAWMAANYKAK